MGASTVSSGWSNHFIELLNIFHLKIPLWLAYDHWPRFARRIPRLPARWRKPPTPPHTGTQAFLEKVAAIMSARPPELVQRAHDLLAAQPSSAWSSGSNLPAFIIALLITAILVIGIQESARFNATIVCIKVAVVLFVIGLGIKYVTEQLGFGLGQLRPLRNLRNRRWGGVHFLRLHGFDAVSTTAQEAKNRSGICRSALSLRC